MNNFDLKELLKINTAVIQAAGYLCPNYDSKIKNRLYFIYGLTTISLTYIAFVLSEIINMIVVFGDIEEMTNASFLLLTHIDEGIKIYYWLKYAARVRKLIDSINRAEFMPKNATQTAILLAYINNSKRITIVFLLMCIATCTLWGVFPFFDKSGDKIKLPLSGWFPFNLDTSPTFEIIFIYQTLCALINGLVNISLDTFMSGTIMIIAGQFAVLNDSLENMSESSTEVSIDAQLFRNIIHHRHIIKFSEEVTFIFTKCIMGQFIISAILISMTMFQMSLLPLLSLQFLSMVLYQACMLLELFLLCYFGNEVMINSAKLTNSAYFSDWVNCSIKFKRNLLFFMTHSQSNSKLYAGNFFILSTETFGKIVKSSYSYFAVLNQVHQ